MPCNHLGPIEIMQLAEERLRGENIGEESWDGLAFGFGENVTGSQWTAVFTVVERRGGSWVVTKIDRLSTPIDPAREGLVRLA